MSVEPWLLLKENPEMMNDDDDEYKNPLNLCCRGLCLSLSG